MSRLQETSLVSVKNPDEQRRDRETAVQVNALSEGKIVAFYTAAAAAPTTGSHQIGDVVRNSAPAEAGAGGSKYVIFGWICSVSGTPGTWLQCRFLTGN